MKISVPTADVSFELLRSLVSFEQEDVGRSGMTWRSRSWQDQASSGQ